MCVCVCVCVCATLNEGYMRAANRGSKNLYRFLIKI